MQQFSSRGDQSSKGQQGIMIPILPNPVALPAATFSAHNDLIGNPSAPAAITSSSWSAWKLAVIGVAVGLVAVTAWAITLSVIAGTQHGQIKNLQVRRCGFFCSMRLYDPTPCSKGERRSLSQLHWIRYWSNWSFGGIWSNYRNVIQWHRSQWCIRFNGIHRTFRIHRGIRIIWTIGVHWWVRIQWHLWWVRINRNHRWCWNEWWHWSQWPKWPHRFHWKFRCFRSVWCDWSVWS